VKQKNRDCPQGRISLLKMRSPIPFVSRFDRLSPESDRLLGRLRDSATSLFPYVQNAEEALANPEQLFDRSLNDPETGRFEYINHSAFSGYVRVLERRIVGRDWLSPPRDAIVGLPPVVVFFSHKGGVGRSTTLAVAASDLASRNLNVLALDLDLEAPGIGSMLLTPQAEPEFGALDYFVENGLQQINDDFVANLTGVSPLTQGRGIIHVVPATGQRSKKNPQNVLGKIARAYLDDSRADGKVTFLDQTRSLLSAVASADRYHAILVDVRAGLNESSAAAILGLGAEVLLFGLDAPQTFEGYKYLLSHLAAFRPPFGSESDWRFRLKMVQAKAPANAEAWKAFRDRSFELFSTQIYDEDETGEAFNFNIDDPDAPHSAWTILNDSNYLEFDPLQKIAQLTAPIYERTFGHFLRELRDRLGLIDDKNPKV
jgi:CobQ/CobB/MinD/ParA nucleotide binding domain